MFRKSPVFPFSGYNTPMGSEVKKSECHVKMGVKYRGETILKTRYSTFFLLCFQCALLLTVVGLVYIVLLSCVCTVVTSCVLLYCVCITILDTLVAGLPARSPVIRKVLQPATSAQIYLVSLCLSISGC